MTSHPSHPLRSASDAALHAAAAWAPASVVCCPRPGCDKRQISIDRTDGRTDERTDTRPLHRSSPHTMRAALITYTVGSPATVIVSEPFTGYSLEGAHLAVNLPLTIALVASNLVKGLVDAAHKFTFVNCTIALIRNPNKIAPSCGHPPTVLRDGHSVSSGKRTRNAPVSVCPSLCLSFPPSFS